MSNMLGVLYEAGIAYTSRTHEFIPVVGTVRFAHYIILVFCVGFFCFVCLRPVSCVPNVASVSGLSILDCPFGFL